MSQVKSLIENLSVNNFGHVKDAESNEMGQGARDSRPQHVTNVVEH